MDLPTESNIANILVALQGTQHDKISTKNLIREKYRTAQDPSDLDNLSGIGPKSKPLHVLEDEYFKSHCNTQHLSERYTLVSSIYGLSVNEPLPSNLTTQIPTTSKPSFLWPSRDHQKGNASKEEQDALKQIKESILDLPVIISTVHETEKKGFGLLARWYWELKHYALMEGKRKRKQSADETSVIEIQLHLISHIRLTRPKKHRILAKGH